jgi:hypothetical protein
MQNSRRQARADPPVAYHRPVGRAGYSRAPLVAGVVEIVSVAVPALAPAMLIGLLEPKLTVGGSSAPEGLEVTDAVSATLPLNPPLGIIVMVDVFPVVAPGAIVTVVPLIAKVGFTAVVTVTVPDDPDALLYKEELEESGV